MRNRNKWLLGGALALALGGYALAQSQLVSFTLNGTENIVAAIGSPGGPSIFVPTAELRNATAFKTFSGSGAQTYTATGNDSVLYWKGTAPTTWTIITPATPWDGQILQLGTDTTLTTLVTLTANTGQSLDSTFSSQTISAKTSVEFQYQLSSTTWFELR